MNVLTGAERQPSGAKARISKQSVNAALKALRHPKSSFSANCKARINCGSERHG
jgi:hypothetical protein